MVLKIRPHAAGKATHARRSVRLPAESIFETLRRGTEEVVTVMWSGPPADYRDDELELVDDYDPKLDLLEDLGDSDGGLSPLDAKPCAYERPHSLGANPRSLGYSQPNE